LKFVFQSRFQLLIYSRDPRFVFAEEDPRSKRSGSCCWKRSGWLRGRRDARRKEKTVGIEAAAGILRGLLGSELCEQHYVRWRSAFLNDFIVFEHPLLSASKEQGKDAFPHPSVRTKPRFMSPPPGTSLKINK